MAVMVGDQLLADGQYGESYNRKALLVDMGFNKNQLQQDGVQKSLAAKIVVLFPTEPIGIYYCPSVKKSCSPFHKPVMAKSKLVNHCRNILFRSGDTNKQRNTKNEDDEDFAIVPKHSKDNLEVKDAWNKIFVDNPNIIWVCDPCKVKLSPGTSCKGKQNNTEIEFESIKNQLDACKRELILPQKLISEMEYSSQKTIILSYETKINASNSNNNSQTKINTSKKYNETVKMNSDATTSSNRASTSTSTSNSTSVVATSKGSEEVTFLTTEISKNKMKSQISLNSEISELNLEWNHITQMIKSKQHLQTVKDNFKSIRTKLKAIDEAEETTCPILKGPYAENKTPHNKKINPQRLFSTKKKREATTTKSVVAKPTPEEQTKIAMLLLNNNNNVD
ncbi:unnamed protein product [Ceutorhynchus assimilis]|uniref:Uncharacterized protein n=1 Tax=Ceutorhynchus assimilis TaxID=467358 RepID=A0A9N9MJW8_9CUCU|nr:unnamed protein product [Ceutorhynchus assimilis]